MMPSTLGGRETKACADHIRGEAHLLDDGRLGRCSCSLLRLCDDGGFWELWEG